MNKVYLHFITTCVMYVTIFMVLNGVSSIQKELFIDPDGNDGGEGTFESPLATLHEARNRVRGFNGTMTGDVVVNLRGGLYELDSTLALGPDDSGKDSFNIIYRAYKKEIPVVSGGLTVTGWTLHDSVKNIYKAKVDSGIDSRQFYVNGRRMVRARSDNGAGWAATASGFTAPAWVSQVKDITRLEVVSNERWRSSRGPAASVSGTSVTMANPYWTLWQFQFAWKPVVSWVENAYTLLDSKGEWFLDPSEGFIYYIPVSGESMDKVNAVLPVIEYLVRGEGVSRVQFEGISFTYATWLRPNTSMGFAVIQAEGVYVRPDMPVVFCIPGNLDFCRSSYLVFKNNRFERMGVSALRLDSGSNFNTIYNNVFRDISGSGISLGPLNDVPDSLIEHNNTISYNLVDSIGREFFSCVGIFAGITRRTKILHNDVINLPYTGISVGWGWSNTLNAGEGNEIAYNLVKNVMQTMDDGGGIYTLSYQPGAIIHHNVIIGVKHSTGGLYPDQGTSSTHWHHNVIAGVLKWLHLWMNTIQNNTINNNYSDNPTSTNNGTNNTVSNNTIISNGAWPEEAQQIMKEAGRNGVMGVVNIALLKPVAYSGVYSKDYAGNKGNDGNSATFWASEVSDNPWYQVTLDSAYIISRVDLVARQDIDQATSRTNFEIRASRSADFSEFTVLGKKTDAAFAHKGTWTGVVDDTATYRYIRVQRINNGGHITFAELRVYKGVRDTMEVVAMRPQESVSIQIGLRIDNASGRLFITGVETLKKAVIYNMQGNRMLQSYQTEMDINSLPKGVYFVALSDRKRQYTPQKFVRF
ncbi:MAG: discoidin domain-containing protein [Fibrobacteria bacterium]|nr:discoidin domain-containing protein [Fibrobacteria bacterium]